MRSTASPPQFKILENAKFKMLNAKKDLSSLSSSR